MLLTSETEKLAAFCQQLQICAKTPVQGKSATFQKVTPLNTTQEPIEKKNRVVLKKGLWKTNIMRYYY